MIIRDACQADIAEMLRIYVPFIKNTVVTFEYEVPTAQHFGARVKKYQREFPWLVADHHGEIAGYAYATKYRERIAYQWVAEVSIYMDNSFHGKGIARTLYTALLEILGLQGIYRVYAVIGLPHPQSIRFHEKMGFKYFATYKNTGYKLGRWCDTGWWECVIKSSDTKPLPITHYKNIDRNVTDKILKKYSDKYF